MANFRLSGRVRSRKVSPEIWLSTLGQTSDPSLACENKKIKIKDDDDDLWSDFESLNLMILFRICRASSSSPVEIFIVQDFLAFRTEEVDGQSCVGEGFFSYSLQNDVQQVVKVDPCSTLFLLTISNIHFHQLTIITTWRDKLFWSWNLCVSRKLPSWCWFRAEIECMLQL